MTESTIGARVAGALRAVAVLALSGLAPVPTPGGDAAASGGGPGWPQYRGPDRSGVSAEVDLLSAFPAGGPPALWRVPLGAGYSGVAAVGDRLYTLEQEGDAQYLACFAREDGRRLWRYRLGDAYRSPYGDGPRSTPVVAGGTVYAVDARGRLAAVRADRGDPLWTRDLVALGARIPDSGYASTPIVVGGRLLVEIGGERAAFVALDVRDGTPLWSSGSDVAAYSSPIEATLGGVRQVVFFSGGGLHALSPEDGTELWRYPWKSLCPATGVPLNSASPVHVPPDGIVVASGYGEERGAARLRIRRAEGGRFDVETVWRRPVLDSRINSPILLDGRLYGFHGGLLQAVDAATGEEIWRARGYGRGSLLAADGRLFVLGEQGQLGLLRPEGDAPRTLGEAAVLDGRTWTAPALADGRLYLRGPAELVALDVRRDRSGAPNTQLLDEEPGGSPWGTSAGIAGPDGRRSETGGSPSPPR